MLPKIRVVTLFLAMFTVAWSATNGWPWWSALIAGLLVAAYDVADHPS